MNASSISSATVERMGWMLVHSLWQFALIALLAGAALRLLRKRSAALRHRLLGFAIAATVFAAAATWTLQPVDAPHGDAGRSVVALDRPPHAPIEQTHSPPPPAPSSAPPRGLESGPHLNPAPSRDSIWRAARGASNATPGPEWAPRSLHSPGRAATRQRPWLTWIVVGWSVGVALCSLRPLLGWGTLLRLRRVGVSPVSDNVMAMLHRVTQRLRLRRTVRVMHSALAKAPVVIGYARPLILLPVSLVTAIPAAQLEALLAHELAHVQRHDFLVNLLQAVVETVFFYHPAVWWLSARMRAEREHCCDDLVVDATGDRVAYGRALLAVEELRGRGSVLAIGAGDGALLARVRRIAGRSSETEVRSPWSALSLFVCVAVVASAMSLMSWDSAAQTPRNEPASPEALASPKVLPTPEVATAPESESILLLDLVNDFNANNKALGRGPEQPPLTLEEVSAAIRRSDWKRDARELSEREFAAFKLVAERSRLPQKSYLDVWTSEHPETFRFVHTWSIRLFLPALDRDGFVGLPIRHTKIEEERIDPANIAWGKADADGLTLGLYLSPRKAEYHLGDRVALRLFVRNDSDQTFDDLTLANITWPSTSDIQATDAAGGSIEVRSVHEEWSGPGWIAGAMQGHLAPGGAHAFRVPFELGIGGEGASKLVGRVLDARPGQTLSLRVRARNGNPRRRAADEPAPETGRLTFTVRKDAADADGPRETVVGVVVSPEGKPVAGIDILAFQGGKQLKETFKTDGRGEFRIPRQWRQTEQWLTLVARDGRERLGWFDLMVHGHSDNGQNSANGAFRLVLLPMSRTIRGRLIDEAGQPVAQIPVRINQLNHEVNLFSVHWRYQRLGDEALVLGAVTGDDGRFELKLPASASAWLGAAHPDWIEAPISVTLAADTNQDLGDIKLSRAARVAGRVIDARTGAPLANVAIAARAAKTERFESGGGEATTDADGDYVIHGLRSGAHTIQVLEGAPATLTAPAYAAAAVTAGETFRADFSLRPGRRLAGRVVHLDTGEPVPHCRVNCSGPADPAPNGRSTAANAKGEFEFFVPPGPSRLDASEGRRFGPESARDVIVPPEGEAATVVLKVGDELELVPGSFKITLSPPAGRNDSPPKPGERPGPNQKNDPEIRRANNEGVIESVADEAILFDNGRVIATDGRTRYFRLTGDREQPAERKELKEGLRVRFELAPGGAAKKVTILASRRGPQAPENQPPENKAQENKPEENQLPEGKPQEKSPQWGAASHGLRARVAPVSSSMSEDAIDLQRGVSRFANADDVAFAVELENVGDQTIQLLDTRYGDGFGESKGKANSDWFGQFLFSIELYDQDGKRIARPEVEVVDLNIILEGLQVASLAPGQTHRFLLRPAKWLSPLAHRLAPNRYAAAIRYHGLPDRVGNRIKEHRPDSAVLKSAPTNVVTPQVAFTVQPPAASPDSQPAVEGPIGRDAGPTLAWGPPSKGLRAAMELMPRRPAHFHGDKPEVKLHIQNVGDQPITLSSFLWLSECAATVSDKAGETVDIATAFYTGWTLTARVTLQPRQSIIYDAGNIGIADSKEQADAFEHVTHRKLVAPSGAYTMQLAVRFGDGALKDGAGKVLAPLAGDWVGDLKTGQTPLSIAKPPQKPIANAREAQPPARKAQYVLPDHLNVMAVGFANDGHELVSVATQTAVTTRTWRLDEKKLRREARLAGDKHGNFFLNGQLTLSGDCRRVIAILDGQVGVWDAVTGEVVKKLAAPEELKHGSLRGLACTPDLRWIACGSTPGLSGFSPPHAHAHAIVWDAASGEVLQTFRHDNAVQIQSLALSNDGKRLATGGQQAGTCVWDVAAGTRLLALPNANPNRKHPDPEVDEDGASQVLCLRFSPDGRQLAVGDMLGVKLLDAATGKLQHRLDAPFRLGRSGLVYSADSQLLARIATDEIVPIWSAQTGRLLGELPTEAHTAAFSADGQWLAVGFTDQSHGIAMWNLRGLAAGARP